MFSKDPKARLRIGMFSLLGSCGLLVVAILLNAARENAIPILGTILVLIGYLAFIVGCGLCASTSTRWLPRAQAIVAALCMAVAVVVSIITLVSSSSPPNSDSVRLEPGLVLLALTFLGFYLLTEENAGRGYALPVLALIMSLLALAAGAKPGEFNESMDSSLPYWPLPVLGLWMIMIYVRLPKPST
jgi:cell division protein FtsW (lipid II flippase)